MISLLLLLEVIIRVEACIYLEINRACFYYPLRIRYHWVLQ